MLSDWVPPDPLGAEQIMGRSSVIPRSGGHRVGSRQNRGEWEGVAWSQDDGGC